MTTEKPGLSSSLLQTADPEMRRLLGQIEEMNGVGSQIPRKDGGLVSFAYNEKTDQFEVYRGKEWKAVGGQPSAVSGQSPAGMKNVLGADGRLYHNSLSGLQGGAAGDCQHLASGEKSGVLGASMLVVSASEVLTAERVIEGTVNQVTLADNGAGSTLVLSLPQDIHTAAAPQFGRLGLGVAADAVGLFKGSKTITLSGTSSQANYVFSTTFDGTTSGTQFNVQSFTNIDGASTGSNVSRQDVCSVNVANTGDNRGATCTAAAQHTSGTVANLTGGLFFSLCSGNGGTTTLAMSGKFAASVGAGSTLVTLQNCAILDCGGVGTVTTQYGLHISQMTKGGTNWQIYSVAGNVYFGAGGIATDTTTGLKIGMATNQKIGFFNVTPVVQPSAWTQTYSTGSKTVANPTYAAPSGGALIDTQCRASLAQLAADVLSILKNITSIIDDDQSLGLKS